MKRLTLVLVLCATLLAPQSGASSGAAIPALYKNCTNVTKRWPHGVGRANAKDKTSGKPVTTFFRSTKIYNTAISHNKGLDRDKDGIACETA